MEKKKYYVSMASGEISQIKHGNNDEFIIHATEAEVSSLRQIFNQRETADLGAFLRAHIPIREYHHDEPNDNYDSNMKQAFQMLYNLGDESTKKHIESIGVLGNNQM